MLTRELLFHLAVRLLGIYSLLAGGARVLASLLGRLLSGETMFLQAEMQWQVQWQVQGFAELLIGGLLLWQAGAIVRWCGVAAPLTGDSDVIAAWSEAALKLLGVAVWAWTALRLPEAYQHWQTLRQQRPYADNGMVLSEALGRELELAVYAVTGLLLLAGARYLAENVIRRQVRP